MSTTTTINMFISYSLCLDLC